MNSPPEEASEAGWLAEASNGDHAWNGDDEHTVIDLTATAPASPADNRPYRVALVTEQALFGQALRYALDDERQICVVAQTTKPALALSALAQMRPDLVLVDGAFMNGDGQFLQDLEQVAPQSTVLVLATTRDDPSIDIAIAAGASGCLTLDMRLRDLVDTVIATAKGRSLLTGSGLTRVVRTLVEADRRPLDDPRRFLTERELEVLRRLAEGATTADLAEELGISIYTVRTHVQNILNKMGVHSRLEAAALAAHYVLS